MQFNKELKGFVESFKNIKISILFIIFFDMLFYALLIFIPTVINNFIMTHPVIQEIGSLDVGIESLSSEQILKIAPMMESFVAYSAISIILMIVTLFLAYSVTRSLVWSIIQKKKLSWKYFKRSLLLNLAWVPILFIFSLFVMLVMFLVMLLAKSIGVSFIIYIASYLMVTFCLFAVSVHFLVYYNFNKLNKIFISIGKAFSFLFSNLKKFVMPIGFMAIVFFIVLLPFSYLSAKDPFAVQQTSILQALVIIIYLAWIRLYFVQLKKEV